MKICYATPTAILEYMDSAWTATKLRSTCQVVMTLPTWVFNSPRMESNKNQTGSLQSYWQKHSAPYAEQKHFMSSGHVDDLDHIVFVTFKLFDSLDVWWRIILIICCHSWEVGFLLVGSSLDLEFWNSAFETWRNWGTSLATLSFGEDQRVQFGTGSSDSSQAWCRILRRVVS